MKTNNYQINQKQRWGKVPSVPAAIIESYRAPEIYKGSTETI